MADLLRRAILRSPFKVIMPTTRIPRRQVLTGSFTRQENFTEFLKQRKLDYGDVNLSSVCLLIDRCSEKNFPFSSLTIDSMVAAINDRDDLVSSMYYLHKFRHCDACYFLRPWTSQTWLRKCMDLDSMDLALKILDENSQYGIFPDDTSFCLLLDRSLKSEDYVMAFKFASHMFLTEMMENKLSQLLCLSVVLKTIGSEDSLNPNFSSVVEHRNFSGMCLRLGQLLNNKDLEILGLANLGIIENEHGIRSVYQDPWGPLMWSEGYLDQAIVECENSSSTLHRQVLNHLAEILKDDEGMSESLNSIIHSLENRGHIVEDPFVKSLEERYLPMIPEFEAAEMKSFQETVDSWIAEHQRLHNKEKDIAKEQNSQREKYFESKRLEKLAKQMAIENLGYWEFMSGDEKEMDVAFHLREDYVVGSSSDVDIERRIESSSV